MTEVVSASRVDLNQLVLSLGYAVVNDWPLVYLPDRRQVDISDAYERLKAAAVVHCFERRSDLHTTAAARMVGLGSIYDVDEVRSSQLIELLSPVMVSVWLYEAVARQRAKEGAQLRQADLEMKLHNERLAAVAESRMIEPILDKDIDSLYEVATMSAVELISQPRVDIPALLLDAERMASEARRLIESRWPDRLNQPTLRISLDFPSYAVPMSDTPVMVFDRQPFVAGWANNELRSYAKFAIDKSSAIALRKFLGMSDGALRQHFGGRHQPAPRARVGSPSRNVCAFLLNDTVHADGADWGDRLAAMLSPSLMDLLPPFGHSAGSAAFAFCFITPTPGRFGTNTRDGQVELLLWKGSPESEAIGRHRREFPRPFVKAPTLRGAGLFKVEFDRHSEVELEPVVGMPEVTHPYHEPLAYDVVRLSRSRQQCAWLPRTPEVSSSLSFGL